MTADVRAAAEEKATELRAMMQDRATTPEDLKQAIEGLQQALFRIGSVLYQQTESAELEDFGVPTEVMSEALAGSGNVSGAADVEDMDATITADYEAID
jgi:molecular chaperone DnaK